MDPAKEQQAPLKDEKINLEDALSAEFDKMFNGETEPSDHVEVDDVDLDEYEASGEEPEEVEDEPEEERAASEEETEKEIQEDEQATAEESNYTEPAPERWPAELKKAYNELPPEQRKVMMDHLYKPMQRSYTQATQELAEMKKAIGPMVEAMNLYRGDFERAGYDPSETFRNQVAWAAHIARVGPEQGIADMRAAWGLDRKEQGQEEYLTPVERSLKARLDQTEQTLSQLQRTQQTAIEQEQQSAQMARVSEVRNELQSFINETKDGKPAHPYVERVAPAIAGIIRGGLVKQVDDYGQPVPIRAQMAQAYKMACDLDPSIRTAAPSPRQAKRVRSAQDVDVVTNHPAGTVNVPGMSIDEVLEAQYEKLSRRG